MIIEQYTVCVVFIYGGIRTHTGKWSIMNTVAWNAPKAQSLDTDVQRPF